MCRCGTSLSFARTKSETYKNNILSSGCIWLKRSRPGRQRIHGYCSGGPLLLTKPCYQKNQEIWFVWLFGRGRKIKSESSSGGIILSTLINPKPAISRGNFNYSVQNQIINPMSKVCKDYRHSKLILICGR